MSTQKLWAPWRLEYIVGQSDKDGAKLCPFCELPKTEPSEENLVLFRDDEVFVIMNKFPYNPGHLLVVPRVHASAPEALPSGIWAKLSQALELSIERLKLAYSPQGLNVGLNLGAAAGAGIPGHLHWHLVPRWAGDTNFMPVIAETKSIPTHNLTVYRHLKKFFHDFPEKVQAAKLKP